MPSAARIVTAPGPNRLVVTRRLSRSRRLEAPRKRLHFGIKEFDLGLGQQTDRRIADFVERSHVRETK